MFILYNLYLNLARKKTKVIHRGDFIPIYTEKENGLLIKIYKNNTSYDSEEDIENKNIDSYFLEIK